MPKDTQRPTSRGSTNRDVTPYARRPAETPNQKEEKGGWNAAKRLASMVRSYLPSFVEHRVQENSDQTEEEPVGDVSRPTASTSAGSDSQRDNPMVGSRQERGDDSTHLDVEQRGCGTITDGSGDGVGTIAVEVDGYQAVFTTDDLRDESLRRPRLSGTTCATFTSASTHQVSNQDRLVTGRPVGMFANERPSTTAVRNSGASGSTAVPQTSRRSSIGEHKTLFFGSNRGDVFGSSRETSVARDEEGEVEGVERTYLWSNSNNSSSSSTCSTNQPRARDGKPAFNITAFHETVNKGSLSAALNRTYAGSTGLSKTVAGRSRAASNYSHLSSVRSSAQQANDDSYKSPFYDGPTAYGGVATAMRSGQKAYPTPYGSRVSVIQRIKPNISKQDTKLGEMANLSVTARRMLDAMKKHDETSAAELRPGPSFNEGSQRRLQSSMGLRGPPTMGLRGPPNNTINVYKRNSAGAFLNKSYGPPIKPLNISSTATLVPNFGSSGSKPSTSTKPGEPLFGELTMGEPSTRPALRLGDEGLREQGRGKDILGLGAGGGGKMKRGRTTQHEVAPSGRDVEETRDDMGGIDSGLASVKPLSGFSLVPGSLGINSAAVQLDGLSKSKPYTFHLPTPVAPMPHSKCSRTFLFSEPKKVGNAGLDLADGLRQGQVYFIQGSQLPEKSLAPSFLSASNGSRSHVPNSVATATNTAVSGQSSQPSLSELFKKQSEQWTCETCLVTNGSSVRKCVACDAMRPGKTQQAAPTSVSASVAPASSAAASSNLPSLSEMFKKKADTWTCDTCFITNGVGLDKCASCDTPRPGGGNKAAASLAGGLVPATIPLASTPLSSYQIDSSKPSLSEMFKKNKQGGQWECGTCMVSNKAEDNKCVACDTPKPGAKVSSDGAEKKDSTVSVNIGSGGGFTFKGAGSFAAGNFGGFGGSSTANSSSTAVSTNGPSSVSVTGGFGFGSSTSSTASMPTTGGFSLGAASSGGFKFGGVVSTAAVSSKSSGGLATSVGGFSASGFTFGGSGTPAGTGSADELTRPALRASPTTGVESQSSGFKSSANNVSMAATASSTTMPGFKFGGLDTTGQVSTASESVSSSSGSQSTSFTVPPITSSTLGGTGFAFGATGNVPCDKAKAGTSDVVSVSSSSGNPAGGFMFGSNAALPKPQLGFESTDKAKTSSTDSLPVLGSTSTLPSFSFGTVSKQQPAVNFGSLNSSVGSSASAGLGAASVGGFGAPLGNSSVSGFGGANGILSPAASNSDGKPSFSFGTKPSTTIAAAPDLTASVGGSNKPSGTGFGGFSASAPFSTSTSLFLTNPMASGASVGAGSTAAAPPGLFAFGQQAASGAAVTTVSSLFQFGKPVDKSALGSTQSSSLSRSSSGLSFTNSAAAGDGATAPASFKFGEGSTKVGSAGGEGQSGAPTTGIPSLFTVGAGSKPNPSFSFSGPSTATSALFASSATPPFGNSNPTLAFGSAATPVTTASTFGAGLAPSFVFGAGSNSSAAPSVPAFGSSAVTTAAPSVFGSGGGFGSTPVAGFFAPSNAPTGFGSTGFGTASTVSSFGSSGFGTTLNSTPAAFGAQPASVPFGGMPNSNGAGNTLGGAGLFGSSQLGSLNASSINSVAPPAFGATAALNNGVAAAPDIFKFGHTTKRSFDAGDLAVPAKRSSGGNDTAPQPSFTFNAPQLPQSNSFTANGVPNFGNPAAAPQLPGGFNFAGAASGNAPSFNFAGSTAPAASAFQFGADGGSSQASAGSAPGRVIRKALRRRPK